MGEDVAGANSSKIERIDFRAALSDGEGGFLKLTRTQEWISGDNSAPMNRKAIAKALQDDRERRKKLSLLEYEAIKRELLLLSVSIGTACSGYCLIAFHSSYIKPTSKRNP